MRNSSHPSVGCFLRAHAGAADAHRAAGSLPGAIRVPRRETQSFRTGGGHRLERDSEQPLFQLVRGRRRGKKWVNGLFGGGGSAELSFDIFPIIFTC